MVGKSRLRIRSEGKWGCDQSKSTWLEQVRAVKKVSRGDRGRTCKKTTSDTAEPKFTGSGCWKGDTNARINIRRNDRGEKEKAETEGRGGNLGWNPREIFLLHELGSSGQKGHRKGQSARDTRKRPERLVPAQRRQAGVSRMVSCRRA